MRRITFILVSLILFGIGIFLDDIPSIFVVLISILSISILFFITILPKNNPLFDATKEWSKIKGSLQRYIK